MAYKPSKRHKLGDAEIELNLNPMMDLFSVLIPCLLMMSAAVQVCVLNVATPVIGSGGGSEEEKPKEKEPLALTVTITDKGYIITGNGLPNQGAGTGPSLPVLQKQVSCSRYRNTRPPPRAMNQQVPPCPGGSEKRLFWVYDTEALLKRIIEIKDAFPEERSLVIAAEPHIEYESIIDVMDSTRDIKKADGSVRVLFDEVVLSPGVL
jgi:biopolymer transport protein ExbD